MKKYLLALIIFPFILEAQTPYHKLLADTITDWYIFNAMPGVSMNQKTNAVSSVNISWGKYSAKTDTTVLSKNYKKFYHIYQFPSFLMNNHEGYIREDSINRKVYFLDKTTLLEDLLYDFSLNVGDSAFFNFAMTSGNFPKGYYKVKAIQNITINSGVRKLFKLKSNAPFSDTLKYIESVGSIIHPVQLYAPFYSFGMLNFGPGCPHPYDLGLACKFANYVKEFQSCTYVTALANGCFFKQDSCNYWNSCGGINELTTIKNINISPNPSFANCTILLETIKHTNTLIELYDISGRKIKSIFSGELTNGLNEVKFETHEIQNGTYFIKAKGSDFEISYPLIISH